MDGHLESLAELCFFAQVARIEEIEDRPQVAHTVLDGRAGQGKPARSGELENRTRLCCMRILDVLSLVDHDAMPFQTLQELFVQASQRERGQDDIVRLTCLREGLSVFQPRAPLMHQRAKLRREALDLLAPVAQYGCRRDDEGRGHATGLLPLLEQASNDLQGFAQAHVVRQTGIQAQVFQVLEPGDTAPLVVAQAPLQGLWIFNGGERILVMEPRQHILQALIMVPFQIVLGLGPNLQHIQERDLRLLVLVRLPELEALLHFVAIQFHPLPPELDEGRFRVHKLLPFLFRDDLTSNRQLVLVGDDRTEAEIALADRSSPFGRTQSSFKADLRTPPSLGRPPRRDDHGIARISKHPGALV